ncbi:signal peptidase I [Bacillus sp. ISL-45]|nr:signal peptidase I [Bacillus sp. ISL-45]MBT2663892.1 signal peptidase I [Bacillus sp. ISL-45]
MKKARKIMSNLITTILFLLLILMIYIVVSTKISGGEPQFLGYQLKTVLSGSMEPTFQTGSIIVVKKTANSESLKKGDVVTFKSGPYSLITHRIKDVIQKDGKLMYQTKGDNNKHADMNALLHENIVAKYTGITIPYLGYLMNFAGSSKGAIFFLIIPGLFFLGYSALTIRKVFKEIEQRAIEAEQGINKSM